MIKKYIILLICLMWNVHCEIVHVYLQWVLLFMNYPFMVQKYQDWCIYLFLIYNCNRILLPTQGNYIFSKELFTFS